MHTTTFVISMLKIIFHLVVEYKAGFLQMKLASFRLSLYLTCIRSTTLSEPNKDPS